MSNLTNKQKGYLEDQDKSEFDQSFAALWRISQIKQRIILKLVEDNYVEIGNLLISYYGEIRCVLKEDDKEKLDDKFKDFESAYDVYKKSYNKNRPIRKRTISNIRDFYFFMQDLSQDYNLNIRKKEDSRHIF